MNYFLNVIQFCVGKIATDYEIIAQHSGIGFITPDDLRSHNLIEKLCKAETKKGSLIYFMINIILLNLRMFQVKDGLKFSFGFHPRQDNPSAFSTPKFPSIQISKDSNSNPFYAQHKFKSTTQRVQIKKTPSQIYKQIGGGGIELIKRDKKLRLKINDKNVSFIAGDLSSIDKNQSKSVKSAQLSNYKHFYRSENKKDRKYYKNKNYRSLANILGPKPEESQQSKVQLRVGKWKPSMKNQQQVQNKGVIIRTTIKDLLIKPQRKDTKKVVNNFFEISPKNIEMRQTKKEKRSAEKQQTGQKQKSKVLKSYLQKARPTLRIAGRLLNNDRLQTIVKDYASEYGNF